VENSGDQPTGAGIEFSGMLMISVKTLAAAAARSASVRWFRLFFGLLCSYGTRQSEDDGHHKPIRFPDGLIAFASSKD
jgi:hypothetical protein